MNTCISSGFTLVEAILVTAIVAVTLGLAIPSFIDFIRTSRLTTQSSRFIGAASLARQEAVKRNKTVIICARDGDHCSEVNQWESGWIIYVDSNKNSIIESEEIIRSFSPLADGYVLRSNSNASGLAYFGDGRIRRTRGGLPIMTMRLCAPDVEFESVRKRSREIVINASGRMRLQYGRPGITKC